MDSRVGSGWLGDCSCSSLPRDHAKKWAWGMRQETTGWGSHRLQVSVGDGDSIKRGEEDSRTLEGQLSYGVYREGKSGPFQSHRSREGEV